MIKIKQTKNGSYSIKGLRATHLEAINTLINHTRLGNGIYENAAFEICSAFEQTDLLDMGLYPDDCCLGVQFMEDEPIIVLSHFND